MRAALRALRKRELKKIVLAVPVAPSETIEEMRDDTGDIVCLEAFDFFGAIGLITAADELMHTLARHTESASPHTERRKG